MRTFLTGDQFAQRAKSGTLPDDVAIRGGFIAEVKAESDSRVLTFTISTSSVDRQGDVVSIDGWDLENYLKNPVVLWAHDYSMPPIGRSLKVWKHSGKLKSSVEFAPADNPAIGPFAEGVYQLYKGGFLNATSVGFLPRKWNWAEDEGRKFGIDFTEQELLEYSGVPVPANPEALIGAKSEGIDTAFLRSWAESILKDSGEYAEVKTRLAQVETELAAEREISARKSAILTLRKRMQ
jgi:HK97 family phage prohead protease